MNGSSLLIWLSLSLLLVYRNACEFCILILCPENLLKLLIILRRFWAETMGSSKYTIVSSENRDNLTSSGQSNQARKRNKGYSIRKILSFKAFFLENSEELLCAFQCPVTLWRDLVSF